MRYTRAPWLILLLFALAVPVQPSHAQSQYDVYYMADPWNGYLIFLSPSTHNQAPGAQGECLGLEEDAINFYIAWLSIHSEYYNDTYQPTHSGRNLRTRGYDVILGQGSTYQENYSSSNYYGANIHLPMHSNARPSSENPRCTDTSSSFFGTHVMYRSGNTLGQDLANALRYAIGPVSPGPNERVCYNPGGGCTDIELLEVKTYATAAYIESEFHDWDIGAQWLWTPSSETWAWRVGVGVDQHLNYPQPRQQ